MITSKTALFCSVALPLLATGLVVSTLARARTRVAADPAAWTREPKDPSDQHRAMSTRRMAERLAALIPQMDPRACPPLGPERVQQVRAELAKCADTNQHLTGLSRIIETNRRLSALSKLGDELLYAGQPEEALSTYAECERLAKASAPPTQAAQISFAFVKRRAMCYLRLGEQQNCCASNNGDSCLLPIRDKGIHTKQYGSREGIKLLTQHLLLAPQDIGVRWSLNIAYMTLGEYPAKVPAAFLIPPRVFQSGYDIKRFPNVASEVGLDQAGLAGGCILEDFDGDGCLDLMVSRSGPRDQLRLYHNNGDGTFTERTKEAGLTGEVGGINLIQADYNNDGRPDVLVLRGGGFFEEGRLPCSLLRNNGDGTFTDVTEQAGLLRFHPTQTAVWFDYNNDGRIDLFIGNQTFPGDKPQPCELFRNNGDGTFTECAKENDLDYVGYVTAAVSADYNNDGRPDLYLTVFGKPNVLLRNEGRTGFLNWGAGARWRFADVTAAAGVSDETKGGPCFFFDYDNDGWPDLFAAGSIVNGMNEVTYVACDYLGKPAPGVRAHLYHNNRNGTFTDVTKQSGLDRVMMALAANAGDLDNDGFPDFYVGTGDGEVSTLVPNRMFRNAGGQRFQEVTTSGDFAHLQKGNAIAFGDIFNTGNQDIFEVMGGAYAGDVAHNALYRNPGHGNHWITLALEGVRSNRAAIGAHIKVTVSTAAGPRNIYKTVGTGGSYGASPLRQEIGLGQATAIQCVEIFWPATGRTQVVRGLTLDQRYKVREEDPQPSLLATRGAPVAGQRS